MGTQLLKQNSSYLKCDHCGELSKNRFCCKGCEVIYNCIQSSGLENFYTIVESENTKLPNNKKLSLKYEFIKDEKYQHDFARDSNRSEYSFYIKGVDCMACTWLFNNIQNLYKSVISSHFKLESNLLEIKLDDSENLYDVVQFISSLGYEVIPLKKNDSGKELQEVESRKSLIRVGVSGALWMNIMIFSISVYAGLEGRLETIFSYLQAILFLPMFFYCAIPFHKSLIKSINNNISIDFPISLSIIIGSLFSYYSVYMGQKAIYFDSISMFIFLILSTRYYLNNLLKKSSSNEFLNTIHGEQQVINVKNGKTHPIHISNITEGDTILIKCGSIVPLSGVLESDCSYMNEALVTGESIPVLKKNGELIKSGVKNLSQDVIIKVTTAKIENSFQDYVSNLTIGSVNLEKYSKFGSLYSVYLVVSIALISIFLIFLNPIGIAIPKILALMIICCPCALGIGMPLATILMSKKLAGKGISVRKPEIFEIFPKIKNLFFDKTGTLTNDKFILDYKKGDNDYLKIFVALEQKSNHPIAQFICSELNQDTTGINVNNFKEISGEGVFGEISGKKYHANSNDSGEVALYCEDSKILTLKISETYNEKNRDLLSELSMKYSITVLTGDKETNTKKFKNWLSSNKNVTVLGSLSPKEKMDHIKRSHHSLYIGDGLNDLYAMKESSLSISLNANSLVNDICDIVFLRGDVARLKIFFSELSHLHKSITKIIAISILYNLIGVSLVLFDIAGPLLAAIVMPLSSLFVVTYTFYEVKKEIS